MSGTIGIMLLEDGASDGMIDEALVHPDDGLTTVRLFAPDISKAGQLVVRNAGGGGSDINLRIHKIECIAIGIRDAIDDVRTLHAFYDLTNYPGTFDFGYFVMAAEIARQKRQLSSLQVYIVRPGREAKLRLPSGYHEAVDEAARDWRIPNVLLPILTLFPSVSGFAVMPDRIAASALREQLANVYPGPIDREAVPIHLAHQEVHQELARTPQAIRPRASVEASRYVRQWTTARTRGRKVVTITLRQYEYLPERNSNIEAWSTFARELTRDGYFPVIVPDTAMALAIPSPEFGDAAVFPEAAFSLPMRMALYESAYLNFATSGGPPALMILSDRCPFVMLKLLVPGVDLSGPDHLTATGFTVGQDPPYFGTNQHLVWENDDLPVIRREFQAMVAKIEGTTRREP
jgi:hypothetical protein